MILRNDDASQNELGLSNEIIRQNGFETFMLCRLDCEFPKALDGMYYLVFINLLFVICWRF